MDSLIDYQGKEHIEVKPPTKLYRFGHRCLHAAQAVFEAVGVLLAIIGLLVFVILTLLALILLYGGFKEAPTQGRL